MKVKFLLFVILLVAIVLRFYKLDSLPPSLEWDEVATGYDAYSILKTGRDQYGTFLPLTFRSLDDYKPPLYTYLASFSIAVWGWNDFAIRFPAAFLGTFSVLTTYGMVASLFQNKKLALLTALLLAISPWHVNFSRVALETNSTIFFTTAGMWAFLKGLKNGWGLPVAAILFGLNLFLYHNTRVFIPILSVILVILFAKDLLKQKFWTTVACGITLLFIVLLIPIVTSVSGKMRFEGTSIFTPAMSLETASQKEFYKRARLYDTEAGIGPITKLFHNQYVLYGLIMLRNYLSHFSPTYFLFGDGNPRHQVQEMGLMYFVELPLILLGFYFLIRGLPKKHVGIVVIWILLAPLPAAVTRDVPHALRSEIFLPMLPLVAAFGLIGFAGLVYRNKYVANVLFVTSAFLYVLNVSFFLNKYLFHFARETSQHWQYGRKEAALYADSIKDNYREIVVSTNLEQPHVFFLYYLKYDPAVYLKEGGTVSGGWKEEGNRFGKYRFKLFGHGETIDNQILYVGKPTDFSTSVSPLHVVKYLNGDDAVWLVEGKES